MFNNKIGSGEAISALIMFIAVLGISTGLVIAFKNYAFEAQTSFQFQNDITVSKLKTSLSISHISYNETSDLLYIYVKNVGSTKLKPTRFDLFVDGEFTNNFTTLYASNLSLQMLLFSPQDTMAIEKNITLGSGSHEVMVVTDLGVSVEDSFNI